MKQRLIFSVLAVAVSTALTGCGGSEGEGEGEENASPSFLQATAIDGYLSNALVWLDLDRNGEPDSDEPQGRTAAGGKITLEVSNIDQPEQFRLMVRAIAGETVDEVRGPVTKTFSLSAPPGVNEVTPLTTLVDLKMQQDPALDRDGAVAAIASELGLQPAQILADFIASGDIEAQIYAINLADQLPDTLPDDPGQLLDTSKQMGQALAQYLQQNPITADTDPDTINVVQDDQGNLITIADQDRDGVSDNDDAFPLDATESKDSDGDKVGDNADAFPLDATESKDSDGDKVGDNADAFPLDATESKDSDGDKVGDNADAFPLDATESKDSDGDKVGDNADAFPLDATESKDSDGDKVGDNADAFPLDATESKDSDGDKIGDNADAFPLNATESKDSDGDKVGDNADAFPLDATESKDSDGDKVGDNSDELPLDPLRDTADVVTTEEEIYSYLEDHSKQQLNLKRVTKQTTSRFLDGHQEIAVEGINYYWNSSSASVEELNGKPLIYSEYRSKEIKQPDDSFERLNWWHKDLNKDGLFGFTGESFEVGTQGENDADYWVFFDEDSPTGEGVSMNPLRAYDGGDLKARLDADDLSTVDMIHHFTVTQTGDTRVNRFLEYPAPKDAATPPYPSPADWFDRNVMAPNLAYVNNTGDAYTDFDPYAETDTYVTGADGCISHTEEQDWQADGNINIRTEIINCPDGSSEQRFAKPIWPNPQDEVFEEYADYNWQNSITMTPYWYEYSVKTELVNSQKVTTTAGARYLLDGNTNTLLVDGANPNGYKFHDYLSVLTAVSPTENIERVSWNHYHLDDQPATPIDETTFTAKTDDTGQDVKIFFKEVNDIWVGHRFAEWGSQQVTNLADNIAALRQQGVTVDQINSTNLPGLSDYDGHLLTSSIRYRADGTPRTWYWVTNLPAITDDAAGQTWKKVPIQLVNQGLDGYGKKGWIINDAAGTLIMLQPKVAEPWGWYDAYQVITLGVWKPNGQVIDPSGRFDTWAGSFYLDPAAADADLANR